jgi:hypothetical protein
LERYKVEFTKAGDLPSAISADTLIKSVGTAQPDPELPGKLKKLQENYNAAIDRTDTPITTNYVKDLERLKLEFARSGDLQLAVAADALIQDASSLGRRSNGTMALGGMSDRQFKNWLSKVTIAEIDSPYGNKFNYDGGILNSTRPGVPKPRTHPTATVEVGRLSVPFTDTNATITIDASMTKAEVAYRPGGTYQAAINPKKK